VRGALALSLLAPLAAGCLARREQPPSRPPSVRVVPAGEIRTAVEWFALSPDGSEVAVVERSATGSWRVQLRRLADGRIRRTMSGAGVARRAIFSPDGSRLAVTCRPFRVPGAQAHYLTIWSAIDGRLLWSADGFSYSGAAAFSPDGRRVAVPEWGPRRVRLLEGETGRTLGTLAADYRVVARLGEGELVPELDFGVLAAYNEYVSDLAFAPDGRAVACAAGDEVRLYPATGGSRSPTLILRSREGFHLFSLAFFPGGETVVACGAQGTLHFWSHGENPGFSTVHIGAGDLRSVACSPDGRFIAVAAQHSRAAPMDDFIALVRPSDGRLLWRADAHPGGALCVAFAAGGNELISAGREGTIKRWRVNGDAHGE
jgi:WD40 repeat protein